MAENKFITILIPQKITLDYIEVGEGKPILFLHGGGTDYNFYLDFLATLSKNYKVFALSLPGFGASSGISRYSLSNLNKVIDSFLKEMHLKNIFIVGHSMGAGLAINYANYQKSSPNIEGLALISPWIKKVNKSIFRMIKDINTQNDKLLNSKINKSVKKRILKYIWESILSLHKSYNSLQLLNLIQSKSLENLAKSLNLKVIGFYSTDDLILDTEDQKEGLELIKGAKIFKFENKGHHLIHLEKDFILEQIQKVY